MSPPRVFRDLRHNANVLGSNDLRPRDVVRTKTKRSRTSSARTFCRDLLGSRETLRLVVECKSTVIRHSKFVIDLLPAPSSLRPARPPSLGPAPRTTYNQWMPLVTQSTRVDDGEPTVAARVVLALTGLSNNKVRGLFDHNCVTLNGQPCDEPRTPVRPGDEIVVRYDPEQGYPLKKRAWTDPSFSIVYEDAQIIVVNKSANILTVATERGGEQNTLENRVSHYFKHTGRRRTAIVVHRLDRGVSGLLVFAKSHLVGQALQEQFKARKPERLYMAIVAGQMKQPGGTFRSHMGTGKNLVRFSTRDETKGELAITHYRVQQHLADTTVVEVQLETGRRNQIRVHFAEHGHPVLGDPRYGSGRSKHERWPSTLR